MRIQGRRENRKKRTLFNSLLLLLFILLLPLLSPAGAQPADGVVITEADYQGLQAFKRSLVDPAGVLRSWNDTGLGACLGAWAGIKCVRGQVIAIQLPWRYLGGRLTEEIGQLTALRKLSLHDNLIGGQIPESIGFLPNLRGLYLFSNRFSGSIPASIGNCFALQAIDLSNNLLVGAIPSSVSNSSKLYRLNLSYNNLSGSIPAGIPRSPSLNFLSLNNNNLSGSVSDTWGDDNVTYQLQRLNIDNNSFSGSIPGTLSRLPLLLEITLSNNQFDGRIPEELGSLPKLQRLDLSSNSISGSFPVSFSNLSSLVELRLDNNLIDGRVPESVDGMQNLSIFSMKKNRLTGEIPETVGNLTNLSRLDFSDNEFDGGIPSSLIHLSNLTFFNVSNNNLSGPVPPALAQEFNESSFRGNIQLCGFSPSAPCPSPSPSPNLPPAESPPAQKTHRRRKLSTRDIILIAAGILLAVLLLLCCILLCCLLRKRTAISKKSKDAAAGRGEKPGGPSAGPEVESGGEAGGKLVHFDGPFVFTADDLLCATAEIMGKSTYGTVYKATLEDGHEVAVKRLREKIAKGQREFESEVNLLGKIRHENLLALRAYYLGPKGEKLLVFDYMSKGSLAAFLHARGPDAPINWATRMSIIHGTTRGLHHPNLKPTSSTQTHASRQHPPGPPTAAPTGSPLAAYSPPLMTAAAQLQVVRHAAPSRYRAPSSSKLKKANTKTDVYSLGVIFLELLTGKSPGETTNGADLPQWVASIVKEEWTNEVFDLELMREVEGNVGDELLNTLKLALHCVDPSPAARPEVGDVLQQLQEIKPDPGGSTDGGGAEPGKE
ncbi:LOW QUALITY PROTEIN: probably inactive leucine-rich repeat receptor-like protein kinase IMK2 [Asparagus officinalis]|uniref:LOW QUALITY PROTEIN: probably inactive leucine-rich repeat receptor-like protein kinase IMK2 n=1 Tax=Asparagus officinalis TaxID=4686 RepID=UPI00098E80AE|nr:LOW QUALITY PROTEIN: probably inactive leucine-rich repeat receptor-like protein kinase IMK2 [Asparagus officinalis]